MNMQQNSTSSNALSNRITLADLEKMIGFQIETVPSEVSSHIAKSDLRYEIVRGLNRDSTILEMISKLSAPGAESGPHRLASWEAGWKENLDKVKSVGSSIEALQPGYCHYKKYRLGGQIVESANPTFETDVNTALRPLLFSKFLAPYKRVVEFGSGTGMTLMLLSKLFPDKEIWGSDWTQSSVDLCNHLAREKGLNFRAFRFDMFSPDLTNGPRVDSETAIITMHSMEQLGDGYGKFLEFILERKPGICLHLEPIEELYDPNLLLDNLALQYHHKRKYLSGYLTAVNDLEKAGRAEVISARRLGFGSLFHEGYSMLVWRPH